jgi:CRISPR-associated endonuclease Cas1
MRYEPSQPLRRITSHDGVCVVEGYGVRINLRHGRLHIVDGLPGERRERVYSRVTPGFSRLVVLGHAGMVSLEALRWLNDLGIGFVQIDKDGRLVTISSAGSADARLRRAQALAAGSESGVEITRTILVEKLGGQRDNLKLLEAGAELEQSFVAAEARLREAASLDELVFAERDAALAYWAAWAPFEIRFRKSDLARLPDHWHRFGKRGSPLTQAPRLSVNPINALLNYLYAILEAETRIACLTLGLDPSLGIVHADYRSRDSLALDLMEGIRPKVDAYVLDLLRQRIFRASDFYESPRGVCRLLSPTTLLLAGTAPAWAQLVAPAVEQVAQALADAPGSHIRKLSTPLTNSKRRARQVRHRPPKPAPNRIPKPKATCRRCGAELPRRERVYCDGCLPHYQREQYESAFHGSGLGAIEEKKRAGSDPTHGASAASRRAEANVARKREAREWDERHGKLVDLSAFQRDILPLIQNVPLSRLQRTTGLSLRYVSLIRRGEKTPHPRHWSNLKAAAESPTDVVRPARDTRQEP